MPQINAGNAEKRVSWVVLVVVVLVVWREGSRYSCRRGGGGGSEAWWLPMGCERPGWFRFRLGVLLWMRLQWYGLVLLFLGQERCQSG